MGIFICINTEVHFLNNINWPLFSHAAFLLPQRLCFIDAYRTIDLKYLFCVY